MTQTNSSKDEMRSNSRHLNDMMYKLFEEARITRSSIIARESELMIEKCYELIHTISKLKVLYENMITTGEIKIESEISRIRTSINNIDRAKDGY